MNEEIAILKSKREQLCAYMKHKLNNVSHDTNLDKEVAQLNEINSKLKEIYQLN